MSYYEYDDLYEKCQNTGLYHLFCFDIKNSKNCHDNKIEILYTLLHRLYLVLESLEKELERPFLVRESPLLLGIYQNGHYSYPRVNDMRACNANYYEPLLFGDSIFLTVYRDAISTDEMFHIFDEVKESLGIPYQFHYHHGYYETNDIAKSREQYFRGDLLGKLEQAHKKKVK